MRVMADGALLAARVLGYLDLRLGFGSSRHGLVTLGAKLHRVGGDGQLAVLRMTLSRAVAHFTDNGLVAAGRPLRTALGVAALAIARSLVHRFLRGDFSNRVGAVVPEAVIRIDREERLGDHRDN